MTGHGAAGKTLVLPQMAAVVLVISLLAYFLIHGVAPGLTRVDSDLPNYLTAARIVADGGEVDRLYDNAWFQQQMSRYQIGTPSQGKFAPFPPPTALLLLPLARLTPLNASRVMVALSLLSLVACMFLMARILEWSLLVSAALLLLSGAALINAVRLGQPYVLVSLSCILGYHAYLKGRPWWAGVCLGLFTPIKYFPVVTLIYFACRRRWQIVLGGAATVLVIVVSSISVLGWSVHKAFLDSVLGGHLTGKLSMQDPFTASFQSFDTLFRRLFVFDAIANPHPMIALPELDVPAVVLTKIVIVGTALATLLRLHRRRPGHSVPISIGILGILTLLLAPATATYHFVLLWLPIGLLVNVFLREGARRFAYVVLGVYALIGFFPYRFSVHFEGKGPLTVLAYPRLWLMLAMFCACVVFVWRPPARPNA